MRCRETVQGRELVPDEASYSMWLRQMGPWFPRLRRQLAVRCPPSHPGCDGGSLEEGQPPQTWGAGPWRRTGWRGPRGP